MASAPYRINKTWLWIVSTWEYWGVVRSSLQLALSGVASLALQKALGVGYRSSSFTAQYFNSQLSKHSLLQGNSKVTSIGMHCLNIPSIRWNKKKFFLSLPPYRLTVPNRTFAERKMLTGGAKGLSSTVVEAFVLKYDSTSTESEAVTTLAIKRPALFGEGARFKQLFEGHGLLIPAAWTESAIFAKVVPQVTAVKIAPKLYYFEGNSFLRQPILAMEMARLLKALKDPTGLIFLLLLLLLLLLLGFLDKTNGYRIDRVF